MPEDRLQVELERLRKRAERERRAREEAELLAEQGIRQLYQRQQELALFNRISDAANGAASVQDAIQVTLDEICAYTGWPVGHAYFVGDEPGLLVSGKIWHLEQAGNFSTFREVTEGTYFRAGVGLPGRVLETREPLWIADVSKDTNFPRAQHSAPLGVKAAFAFPVLVGTTVAAVLEFFSCEQVEQQETWLKIAAQAGIQLGRIFERQRARADLEKAHLELMEANRLQSEFLANMSHEIRTPMNGVIGVTDLLLTSELNQEQRELVRTVRISGESLLVILNDILDFSKIEAGKLELNAVDFNLEEVLNDMMDLLAPLAHGKRLELAALVQPEVPLFLVGDPGRLRQILNNLLGNAVKFTAEGEVALTISLAAQTATHARINFEIRDTGIGIDASVQPRLFQAFSQADGSNTRKYGGTGLGLAICKKLVALMNGDIQFTSKEGQGSSFFFTVEFQKQAAPPAPAPTRDLSAHRLLIVEDNPTVRRVVAQYARAWGMRSDSAPRAHEAIQMLQDAVGTDPYEVVLLDLRMPELDGISLARMIKSNPALAATHLIMLTSLGDVLESMQMEQTGIEACVPKPVKGPRLFDSICEVVGGKKNPTPERLRALTGSLKLLGDPTGKPVRILLAEDNVINQKVAVKMLRGLGYGADIANNGLEVLAALSRKRYDLVLMDCQMPELDGYETTRRIRHTPEWSSVRIVAVTANSMSGEDQKCLQVGMDDYLSKPVRLESLREILVKWMPSESKV
jgi:signal transduction histidine kinase/CheY-like chemotaxis protein